MHIKMDIMVDIINKFKKFEDYVCNNWFAIIVVWVIGIAFWGYWLFI